MNKFSIAEYKFYRSILDSAYQQYDAATMLFHQLEQSERIVPFHIIQCWKVLVYLQSVLKEAKRPSNTLSENIIKEKLLPHLKESHITLWEESFARVHTEANSDILSKDEHKLQSKDIQYQLNCLKEILRHYEKFLWNHSLYKDRFYKLSAIILTSVLACMLLGVGIFYLTRSPAKWLVRTYNNINLEGPPLTSRVSDVNFNWADGSPIWGVDKDNFSVRFDTCMIVEKDADIYFKLGSDDGSRLYINNKLILDHWGDHGFGFKQGKAHLKRGIRNIRVEYYDGQYRAMVVLKVSHDSKQFTPLNHKQLIFPGDNPSEPFCVGISRETKVEPR